MKNLGLALILLASLGACSQIAMDATGAAAQATAAGHPERAACYMAIGQAAGTKPTGLLTKFESVVELRELAEGQCSSIVGGLAVHLLDKIPFTP